MKNQKYKYYLYWGITAFAVIAACIAFAFLIIKGSSVRSGLKELNSILAPITYGAILAYLLTPIYNRYVNKTRPGFEKMLHSKKAGESCAKAVGTLVSLVLIIVVVVGLFWMILPQVITTINGVIESFPNNADMLYQWLQQVLADNPQVEETVLGSYEKGLLQLETWVTTDLVKVMSSVVSGVLSGVVFIKNLLIGLIVMVYLLNIKDLFAAQSKKLVYGLFPLWLANRVIEKVRFIHQVFGGFIIGKLLDSLIIGIICFVCLTIMKMPYIMLISVIVGVTNIIPFFGPFIGAIPSAVLLLFVSPIKCLYFLIFILLLQQFDGNILGPKILGNSTGLSSFWVLFSILVFGGILGPIGMIIGVPAFAVIYSLISEWVCSSLKKKELSVLTDDYHGLDHIDEEKKTYIK
ncbi:MAG: AI-2E family transporter [Clostridiaceae bacterium]|nr:AI-2E family transporter [Clostridiaceae bacterium]